jgi:hypothetical protein
MSFDAITYAKVSEVGKSIPIMQISGGFNKVSKDRYTILQSNYLELLSGDGTDATANRQKTHTVSSIPGTTKSGITITTKATALKGLRLRKYENDGGYTNATTAYVINTAGTILATYDITTIADGAWFTIYVALLANTTYYVAVDKGGATWNGSYTPIANYGYNESDLLTVKNGYYGGEHSYVMYFGSIGGITEPPVSTKITVETDANDAVSSYEKILYNTHLPLNTSVSCRVLSANGTELIASVDDGSSLESINVIENPVIKFEFTLTRSASTDPSPKLYYPSWLWVGFRKTVIGTDWSNLTPKQKGYDNTEQTAYTVLDITGSGFIHGLAFHVGVQYQVSINIDGVVQNYIMEADIGANTLPLGILRFNKSLKVMSNYSGVAYWYVSYSLD